jgi:hypothetical protein
VMLRCHHCQVHFDCLVQVHPQALHCKVTVYPVALRIQTLGRRLQAVQANILILKFLPSF